MADYRVCDECGNKMYDGYLCDCGEWYCCENCMHRLIEDGKMRHTPDLKDGEENEMGGYYDKFVVDEWVEVPVFWTCWYD